MLASLGPSEKRQPSNLLKNIAPNSAQTHSLNPKPTSVFVLSDPIVALLQAPILLIRPSLGGKEVGS